MKNKEEFLNTKFNREFYKAKHLSSQYIKQDSKPSLDSIFSSVKTKIKDIPQEPKTKDTVKNNPIMTNSEPITITPLRDADGLSRAYDRESNIYIHGDTIYLAGTTNMQDVWDDVSKVTTNRVAQSAKYKNAAMILEKNPQVVNIVGHSLSGSVSVDLQRDFPERNYKIHTYGAPLMKMSGPDNINQKRFRSYLDPVSMFDRGAKSTIQTKEINMHTYDINDEKISDKPYSTYVYRTDS